MRLHRITRDDWPVTQRWWTDVNDPKNPWRYADGRPWNPYPHGHCATDVGTPRGVPLLSPIEGHVKNRAEGGGYGVYVIVVGTGEHTGYTWLCAHGIPGSFQQKEGALVQPGDPLLLADNTGFSTGNHVHGEMWGPPIPGVASHAGRVDWWPLVQADYSPPPPWMLMTKDERIVYMEALLQQFLDATAPLWTNPVGPMDREIDRIREELERYRGTII